MNARGAIRLERLTGDALSDRLDDVANLRITVFRDWPYLYDGDMTYERAYLQSYRESNNAILVAAFDGERLVGASTGTPMEDHAEDFGAALNHCGVPLTDIFYCAESVLLPEYRGQGLGHAFFDAREAHARTLRRSHAAFCAVIRPEDHPLKPACYRPLDAFWRKRGYVPLTGAIAQFSWKDRDQPNQTEHPLQFWMREL
ncbi:MAG: GNAT family N-acetyltransferase [Pseudomonadota bacterium]